MVFGTPVLSRVFGITSWGRMSEGEDVGGTLWGRMSEGGNPRDGRTEVFEKDGFAISLAKFVKSLKDSSCVFDWSFVFQAARKFVEGASRAITKTPVKNLLESCLIVLGRLRRAFSWTEKFRESSLICRGPEGRAFSLRVRRS